MFFTFRSSKTNNDNVGDKKSALFLYGIEPENNYGRAKLAWFVRTYQVSPDPYDIIVLSKTVETVREQDGYTLMPWQYQTRARLLGWQGKLFFRRTQKEEADIKALASRCIAMVDLGDQQVSSDLGTGWTANMLANMVFAKAFAVPCYVFPQFFGPTRYPMQMSIFLKWMIRSILPSATALCVRDQQSQHALTAFSKFPNIRHCLDALLYQDKIGVISTDANADIAMTCILSDDKTNFSEDDARVWLQNITASGVSCTVTNAMHYHVDTDGIGPDRGGDRKPQSMVYITNDYYTLITIILSGSMAIFIQPDRKAKSIYEPLHADALMVNTTQQLEAAYRLVNTSKKLLLLTEQFHRTLQLFLQNNPLPGLRELQSSSVSVGEAINREAL